MSSRTSARHRKGGPARKAIDLTADSAILTALANDIGTEVLFGRQIIAYAGAGDAALALSTSGDSANIIEALAEADRRGLLTIAFVGYDGGRVAREGLADHVVVTNRSTSRGSRRHRPRPTTPCASSFAHRRVSPTRTRCA
jgi:Phosphoheptose isomerase